MGSSSKKQTVGYWYRLLYHFGLCKGPIDALLEFRAGDRTAWQGALLQSGRISIDRPNLWGGEASEGGLVGEFDLMMGAPTQGPNDYLTARLGPEQPNYRGKTTGVWRGGRWGAMNPYPKPAAFKVRRILRGWDDDTPWYPEKAQILLVPARALSLYFALDVSGSMAGTRLATMKQAMSNVFDIIKPFLAGGRIGLDIKIAAWSTSATTIERTNCTEADIEALRTWVNGRSASGGTNFDAGVAPALSFFDSNAPRTNLFFFVTDGVPTGSSATTAANLAADFLDQSSGQFTSERGNAVHMYGINIELADTTYTAMLDNTPQDGVPVVSGSDSGGLTNAVHNALGSTGSLVAMNPVHILYDSLTARDMQGEPSAMINQASFLAAADRCHAEAFGLCTSYEGGSIADFQQRICDVIGGCLTQSRIDGQYYVDLVRGDYDLTALPVISADDILEFSQEPSVLTEQVNQIAVEWFDPQEKEKRTTAPLQSMGAIQAAGRVIAETRQYPEIAAENLALRVGARDLQAASTPLSRFRLTVNRRTFDLRPGRQFRLQYPAEGIGDMVCLLADIDYGTLTDGRVRLVAVQDVFGFPQTVYVTPESGLAEPPNDLPVASTHQRVFEAPYVELVGNLSRADLAALPPDVGVLMTVAARPLNGLDYVIYTATLGEAYDARGTAEWCPTATVVEAADYLDTAFTLSGGQDLSEVAVGAWALWEDEIVRIDAIDATAGTVTVGRGCADTVPARHPADSHIYFCGEWSGTDGREYVMGETVRAKLLTRTSTSVQALAGASELTAAMAQRHHRPYPPGNVRINGQSYPSESQNAISIRWSHRDRLLQADQLIDTTMGDIGPEPGVTYGVVIRDSIDSIVHSVSGLSGTEYTVPNDAVPDTQYCIVELFSERAALRSVAHRIRVELDVFLGDNLTFVMDETAAEMGGDSIQFVM